MRVLHVRGLRLFPDFDSGSPSSSINEERRETLLTISAREYPQTLTWAGIVVLLMTTVTFVGDLTDGVAGRSYAIHVNDIAAAVVLFGSAWLLHTDLIERQYRDAVFATAGVVLIFSLLWQTTVEGTALNFTYAMFVLIGFGATALSARAYLTGSAMCVGAATLVAWYGPVGHAFDWTLVAVAAACIGGILLRIRLQSIVALADATELAKRLATQDQLTGVFNRHGLMEHVPGLWSTALRYGEDVFVAFIDIRDLKVANDQYGHDYGDRIIRAAARSATQAVRGSDLVARWGGDEFVIVGIGSIGDAFGVESRLQSTGEWTIGPASGAGWSVRIGFAAGRPDQVEITELIRKADEDMYLRRKAEEHISDR